MSPKERKKYEPEGKKILLSFLRAYEAEGKLKNDFAVYDAVVMY